MLSTSPACRAVIARLSLSSRRSSPPGRPPSTDEPKATLGIQCVFSVASQLCRRPFDTVDATIARPADTLVVVDDLPVGATCVVRETDDGGAAGDNPPPGTYVGTVVITDDPIPTVDVTVTNEFLAGRVSITKQVDGTGAGGAAGVTFTLQVSCQRRWPGPAT